MLKNRYFADVTWSRMQPVFAIGKKLWEIVNNAIDKKNAKGRWL